MAILTFLGSVALLTMLVIAGWRVIVASGNQLFICWHRMTPFGRIIALLAVGVSVLYGGGKTNDAARAISRSAHRGASATDSQMVARARNWNIRGAWDDSFDLTFANGFVFPFGTNRLTSIEVFSQGYLRPSTTPFPVPHSPFFASSPLSLIPNHSSFSYEHTPSNTYRFVWNNVPFGRIPLGNLSIATNDFSIELFRNGDSVISSNGITRLVPYVCPGDWDGDGIPNEKDTAPAVPNGENFGPCDERPDNANSAAYRTIDLVSRDVTAEIRFVGDGVSNLPDPHFIARQGTTNRVTFLAGKTYRIESAFTLFCAGVSDSATVVTNNSECSLTIVRPVTFSRVDTATRSAGGFRMNVDPPDLNGVFHWTSNACCTVTGLGSLFSTHCDACTCGGCMLGGIYVYEGYALGFGGIACGCSASSNPEEEENTPSVGVSFSEGALFYEEAYTNAPGDVVARRHSTNVTVRVSASGGPRGGVFTLTRSGFDKLSFVEGDPLPEEIITLAPNETRSWRAEYAPRVHSEAKDDVTISARFEEYLTGNTLSDEDKMTVVKLKLTPIETKEGFEDRHVVGVRETIECFAIPDIGSLSEIGGGEFRGNGKHYVAPLIADGSVLSYVVDGSCYIFEVTVIEPSVIVARSPKVCNFGLGENTAGGAGMELEIYILPETVSFTGIAMEEVPLSEGVHVGYFANVFFENIWCHTLDVGAGQWFNIKPDNYWSTDSAMMGDILPLEKPNGDMTYDLTEGAWSNGELVWHIHWGWRDRNAETGDEPVKSMLVRYDQTFRIDSKGTLSVSKFGHVVSRGTNDVIRLNGNLIEEP